MSAIPDKLYFKIGEVAGIIGVKPYVLRYWETEFSDISPIKSRTNQRLYKRRDVELIVHIKELLYQERFTIDGARKKLKVESKQKKDHPPQLDLGLGQKEKPASFADIKTRLSSLLSEMEGEL